MDGAQTGAATGVDRPMAGDLPMHRSGRRVPFRPRCRPTAATDRSESDRVPTGRSGTIATMTVPARADAASLLLSLDPPPWFLRHARAVAEVAAFLAARIADRGTTVDRRLVETAALLHDVDKLLAADDPAHGLPHGEGSAAWLTRHGHPELARAVAGHPVTRLLDGERYRRWAGFATREERIVAYADKRAGQRLEPMAARFASWQRRYPGSWDTATCGRGLGPRRTARGRRLPGRRPCPDRRAATGVDRRGPARRTRRPDRRVTTPPLAFIWGDDDLGARRAVDRLAATLASEGGVPLERWDLAGQRAGAGPMVAQLHERIATPVMFGGGTLAVVSNVGALMVTTEGRDGVLAAIGLLAPGNALVILDATQSGAKAPSQVRVLNAVKAAGGSVVDVKSPKGGGLAAWIEREARERGLTLEHGRREGARVADRRVRRRERRRAAIPDADRLERARQAGALSRQRRRSRSRMSGPSSPRPSRGPSGPSSTPSASARPGRRRAARAPARIDRRSRCSWSCSIDASASSSRSAIGSRAGETLATAAKAMGIKSEFRAGKLAGQARNWTTPELIAALDGLLELDAMVKGAPDTHGTAAQRRLAFTLWLMDHVERGSDAQPRSSPAIAGHRSVGGGPGLFLDHEIALDGEDAAALAEIEQLDQVRVDVELRAVLAQPARDAEAQPLAPVGQPERRVEPGRDEPATAGRATISQGRHGPNLMGGPPRTA